MGPMGAVTLAAAVFFAAGSASAWLGFVRWLLIACLVLAIVAAGFTLLSIVGSGTLGIPRATGPAEGLGAGAAVLMVFVIPPLVAGFVVFLSGWAVGWILREATRPDGAIVERRTQDRIARRIEAMEEYNRGRPAPGAAADPAPGDRPPPRGQG